LRKVIATNFEAERGLRDSEGRMVHPVRAAKMDETRRPTT
jgi:hypothetical protein